MVIHFDQDVIFKQNGIFSKHSTINQLALIGDLLYRNGLHEYTSILYTFTVLAKTSHQISSVEHRAFNQRVRALSTLGAANFPRY